MAKGREWLKQIQRFSCQSVKKPCGRPGADFSQNAFSSLVSSQLSTALPCQGIETRGFLASMILSTDNN